MVKVISLVLFIGLTGCATTPAPIEIKTEIQETFVPLLYCPAPVKIERPVLPIHVMTPDQKRSDGELAKHYKATILSLIGYSKELELSLDKYSTISDQFAKERTLLEDKYGKAVVLPTTQPEIR